MLVSCKVSHGPALVHTPNVTKTSKTATCSERTNVAVQKTSHLKCKLFDGRECKYKSAWWVGMSWPRVSAPSTTAWDFPSPMSRPISPALFTLVLIFRGRDRYPASSPLTFTHSRLHCRLVKVVKFWSWSIFRMLSLSPSRLNSVQATRYPALSTLRSSRACVCIKGGKFNAMPSLRNSWNALLHAFVKRRKQRPSLFFLSASRISYNVSILICALSLVQWIWRSLQYRRGEGIGCVLFYLGFN